MNEQVRTVANGADTQALVSTRVQQYIMVRDHLKVLEEEYEARRKPFVDTLNSLTGWIMTFLEKTGSESVRTEHGTCYASTRYTASVSDADAFMKYVLENQAFDLLDRRANSTAVKDFVKKNNCEPPGAKLNALRTIGVRKK